MNETHDQLIGFTAEIAVAFAANQRATADEIALLLPRVYNALSGLSQAPVPSVDEPLFVPAVPPRSSVKPDFITSLIDGKQYKTLKRHLSNNGLTPEQYRQRYGLKPDYPMVAPNYTEVRRALAVKIGLGRKPGPRRKRAAK